MVRLYGKQPYKIVLVHGGPGAMGSLKGFAKELHDRTNIGVVEAIQSKYSMTFLYGGDMNQLLQVLAKQQVQDLSISEPDLEEIFMHYYADGGEA